MYAELGTTNSSSVCITRMNTIILILVSLFYLTVQFFLFVEHYSGRRTFSNHEVGLLSANLGSVQCFILSDKIFYSILVETNPIFFFLKGKIQPQPDNSPQTWNLLSIWTPSSWKWRSLGQIFQSMLNSVAITTPVSWAWSLWRLHQFPIS